MAATYPDNADDLWIYHEKQMSSLCGQHCINNLVQGARYTAGDLAEIAHELDEREREHMLAEGVNTPDALRFLAEESGNVDAAGNFSIQVLNTALKRLYGVSLVSAASESIGGKISTTGFACEKAFVLNRHSHWVAIRSIGGVYWDLNSMVDHPSRITTFALEAYLYQLREDGYSVFVVRGNDLPAPGRQPGEGSRDCWYSVKGLLEASRAAGKSSGSAPSTASTDVWLNSGPGRRPDERSGEGLQAAMAMSASLGGVEGGLGDGGLRNGNGDDDDIALAIALSLQQHPPGVFFSSTVPTAAPPGPDTVRVQLRIGDKGKLVHGFSKVDPITTLFDVAAHALAEQDGKPLAAPFDVVAPGGRHLLKAGQVLIVTAKGGEGQETVDNPTIESQQLGGASVMVRRSNTR
ncbi:unnamed protein product [Ascophyllum nodosum]